MSMLNIVFPNIWPKRIKRSRHDVAWYFVHNWHTMMAPLKLYKSVQIPLYAVSFLPAKEIRYCVGIYVIFLFLTLAQPPGVPEICKKSLNSCPVDGGLELFIIGKNFLKDTHVIFQETYDSVNDDDLKTTAATANDMSIIGGALWEQTVLPDKEYLQQVSLSLNNIRFINYYYIITLKNKIKNVIFFLNVDSFNMHCATVYTSEYNETSHCTSGDYFERQKK